MLAAFGLTHPVRLGTRADGASPATPDWRRVTSSPPDIGYDKGMTTYDVHRPVSGDVIDLIVADHYLMEHLLRQMRDDSGDREVARRAFAAVHVAHAESEERYVYPAFRERAREVGQHEVEHGNEEHAEGTEALLKVMELKGTDTKAYEDAVEELSSLVSHHLVEEELTLLNPARRDLSEKARLELGATFAAERRRQIDSDCGSLANLRRLVAEAKKSGDLPTPEEKVEKAGQKLEEAKREAARSDT